MRFRKCISPSGLAEEPPKTWLASGLLCLSDRVSFLKESLLFHCIILWEGYIFWFYVAFPQTIFLTAILSFPVKWCTTNPATATVYWTDCQPSSAPSGYLRAMAMHYLAFVLAGWWIARRGVGGRKADRLRADRQVCSSRQMCVGAPCCWPKWLGDTLARLELYRRFTMQTLCLPERSRWITPGWYSVHPALNDVAHLFRFDRTSGFAKICWPDDFMVFLIQSELSQDKFG